MSTYKYISNSEQDTKNFAKKLASKLHIGDVIVLTGELGAGKTKFTEGFLSYYGLENEISSEKQIYTSKRYLATKLKIFKCVIYKNLDPNVNEESIKNMLKRNGSQGFVIKLPQVI